MNSRPRFTAQPFCHQWQTRETAEYWYVYDNAKMCAAVGTGAFATEQLAQDEADRVAAYRSAASKF